MGAYGNYGSVILSKDDGVSWNTIYTLQSTYSSIQALAMIGTNILAGSDYCGLFLSNNNGSKWNQIINGLSLYENISSFVVNGANIFAGTLGNGVFLSNDNGNSWGAVNNGLSNNYVFSFAKNAKNIFVGTLGGVFLSNDNGNNWTSVNTGLAKDSILALAIDGTNIYAGTYSHGVWKRKLSEMVGISERNNNSNNINIYPNPNSGKFIIKVDNNAVNIIKLEIYNFVGEKIFIKSNFNIQNSNEIDISEYPIRGSISLKLAMEKKVIQKKLLSF